MLVKVRNILIFRFVHLKLNARGIFKTVLVLLEKYRTENLQKVIRTNLLDYLVHKIMPTLKLKFGILELQNRVTLNEVTLKNFYRNSFFE